MLLHRKSVELLAPAGTWDAMTAAIDAGADAVYLGGKHFNMRLHEGEQPYQQRGAAGSARLSRLSGGDPPRCDSRTGLCRARARARDGHHRAPAHLGHDEYA